MPKCIICSPDFGSMKEAYVCGNHEDLGLSEGVMNELNTFQPKRKGRPTLDFSPQTVTQAGDERRAARLAGTGGPFADKSGTPSVKQAMAPEPGLEPDDAEKDSSASKLNQTPDAPVSADTSAAGNTTTSKASQVKPGVGGPGPHMPAASSKLVPPGTPSKDPADPTGVAKPKKSRKKSAVPGAQEPLRASQIGVQGVPGGPGGWTGGQGMGASRSVGGDEQEIDTVVQEIQNAAQMLQNGQVDQATRSIKHAYDTLTGTKKSSRRGGFRRAIGI